MPAVPFYKSLPALAAYIDRIGADELNFRTFLIRQWHGQYYKEVAKIKIDVDGTIECTAKEYFPTKEEREAIEKEIVKATWPKHVFARDAADLPKRAGSEYFEFIERRDGSIIMVQERTGAKDFYPWTYWSDKEWRQMEPDDGLPLWKPRDKRSNYIMIHEGAKAARACERLVSDPNADHPWKEFLSDYEHWGMIGGALAPQRTDWSQLRREQPVETIYVCDNDFPGKSALQEVSRLYGRRLKGLSFTDAFPLSFDLADPFPKEMFSPTGRYIGPHIEDLIVGATWATEPIPQEGRGRPSYTIKTEFERDWFHAVNPDVYIHRERANRIWTKDAFNSLVSPFSNADDTARLLRKRNSQKSASLGYHPGFPPGIQNDNGAFFNTHVGSRIKPERGDITLWRDYMAHLIPDEGDRFKVEKWIATLIARPEVKMHYGLLLISEMQGVGKSTLGDYILKPLLGAHNVSQPSEKDFVENGFNYWAAHKRLAIIQEIYAGHSSKAYDGIKSYITDETIRVQRKFLDDYSIQNWIHFVACSNSMKALRISDEDRRWLIPRVSEEKQSENFWYSFHEWLADGGLNRIKQWAEDFVAAHGSVKKGEEAPETELKRDVIRENMSPGLQKVYALLTDLKARFIDGREPEAQRHFYIADQSLVKYISDELYGGKHNDRLEKPATVRKLARGKDCGWFIHPTRYLGAHGFSYLICSHRADIELHINEIRRFGIQTPNQLRTEADQQMADELHSAGRAPPTDFEIDDQPPGPPEPSDEGPNGKPH